MQQEAQQQKQTTTLAQKMEFTASLALFPALTVMVFTHRKLGYRFLSPIKLLIMAVLLVAAGSFAGMAAPFAIFALVMFAFGMIKRRTRWTDLTVGIPWHTYSRGYPWLDVILEIPRFTTVLPITRSFIRRYLNPLLVAVIGILLFFPLRYLGLYIVFAAVCLMILESYDYDRNLNLQLDMMDRMVEAEYVDQDVAFFSGPNPFDRPVEQTGGIPTGVSPDLAAAIERRKARGQQQIMGQPQQYPPPMQQPYP